jgi:hypothetical protein
MFLKQVKRSAARGKPSSGRSSGSNMYNVRKLTQQVSWSLQYRMYEKESWSYDSKYLENDKDV